MSAIVFTRYQPCNGLLPVFPSPAQIKMASVIVNQDDSDFRFCRYIVKIRDVQEPVKCQIASDFSDIYQGCTLRVPGCLRRLTFAFGRPDNLISFIYTVHCKLYAGHPGSHSLETLGSLKFLLEHSLVHA